MVGGDACIRNTRIAVWHLVEWRKLGKTDEEIRTMFAMPLTPEDIAAGWQYYADHTQEIEQKIRDNNET